MSVGYSSIPRHGMSLDWLLQAEVDQASVLKRINWHILPLFFGLALMCAMDRANLSFASPQLNHDLHFSDEVYGLGSGRLALQWTKLPEVKVKGCLVGFLPFVRRKAELMN